MNNKIKISVIIPVYNTSAFLRECLDTVCNQTLRDFEVIIVNDASTDHSSEIIGEYCDNNSNFISITHSENKGLPSARNSGVDVAKGVYIIHLDSDDYWTSPETLQLLYDIAETDKCDILRFNGVKRSGTFSKVIFVEYNSINTDFHKSHHLWHFKCVFLFLFRRSFLELNGAFFKPELSIGEDAIFLSSILSKSKKISTIPNQLYNYRVNEESMMRHAWTFDKYIAEQRAAFATSENLRCCQPAWQRYWQYRLNHYWSRRVLLKAFGQFSTKETFRLIEELRGHLTQSDKEKLLNLEDASRLSKYLLLDAKENNLKKTLNRVKPINDNEVHLLQLLADFIKSKKVLFKVVKGSLDALKNLKKSFSQLNLLDLEKDPYLITNTERREDFNAQIKSSDKTDGVSAMIRVKNEEDIILDCLNSIGEVFDELIVVDNGSEDDTLYKINQFQEKSPNGHKVKLYSYPFEIAKCGQEHQNTPFDSIHSLVYYYNWCLSYCTRKAVFKWDADMVLSSKVDNIEKMRNYLNYFSKGQNRFGIIGIQTIYVYQDGEQFLSKSEINREIRVFKNTPSNHYEKGEDWEVLKIRRGARKLLNEVIVYEIKDVRKDEFSHWTTQSFSGERKAKEFRNFNMIKNKRYRENRELFEPIDTL